MTHGISDNATPQEKIAALTEAFDLFSKETTRLESAYKALKEQFRSVNIELEETNRTLNQNIIELDVTSNYLKSILNNISQGILFIGLTGRITTYNPAAEKILGIQAEKILGNYFWDHFSDDCFNFSMRQALATGTAPDQGCASVDHQTSVREIEFSTAFSLHDEVSAKGLVVLIRDMTEIRRLQTIASRNDRMKELGEMAASVAHEIRNPLGGIKGFASLLHRDLNKTPHLQQMAHYIVEGTTTIDRLVTEVLNYSRPVQVVLTPCDINKALEEVSAFMRADQALIKGVKLQFIPFAEQLLVPLDVQLFRSALLNLMVNGAQAMPNGGTLTLSCSLEKSRALVTVTDTGDGIAEENLEKIFSPFFTTKPKGNGFGLSEVYKIIQAHGASINVRSELGRGTIFTLAFSMKI